MACWQISRRTYGIGVHHYSTWRCCKVSLGAGSSVSQDCFQLSLGQYWTWLSSWLAAKLCATLSTGNSLVQQNHTVPLPLCLTLGCLCLCRWYSNCLWSILWHSSKSWLFCLDFWNTLQKIFFPGLFWVSASSILPGHVVSFCLLDECGWLFLHLHVTLMSTCTLKYWSTSKYYMRFRLVGSFFAHNDLEHLEDSSTLASPLIVQFTTCIGGLLVLLDDS